MSPGTGPARSEGVLIDTVVGIEVLEDVGIVEERDEWSAAPGPQTPPPDQGRSKRIGDDEGVLALQQTAFQPRSLMCCSFLILNSSSSASKPAPSAASAWSNSSRAYA